MSIASSFVSHLTATVLGQTRPSSRPPLLALVLVAVLGGAVSGCTGARWQHPSPVPAGTTAEVEAPLDTAARVAFLYLPDGTPANLEEMVAAASEVDVVFVGERHGDVSAHRLQLALLEALLQGAAHRDRGITLSLEMFETDVQLVLDEYLAGLISEDHFLAAARPWPNYQRDYRPLVERARDAGIPVVAANAPRRYVNRVARMGRQALNDLPDESIAHLPPLPYVGPSEAYRSEWNQRMEAMAEAYGEIHGGVERDYDAHGHGGEAALPGNEEPDDPALEAQALWDAAMAYSIHRALDCAPQVGTRGESRTEAGCSDATAPPLVLHLTGSFHVENRTGTPEALRHFRPNVRDLVITVRAVANPADFSEAYEEGGAMDVADFILLTPSPSVGGHP